MSLTLALLLFFAYLPSQQSSDCETLATEVLSTFSGSWVATSSRVDRERLLADAERVRRCIGAASDSLAVRLLHTELYLLNFDNRYREALFRLSEAPKYVIPPTDSVEQAMHHHWHGSLHRRLSRPIDAAPHFVRAAELTLAREPVLRADRYISASHEFSLSNRPNLAYENALLAVRSLDGLVSESSMGRRATEVLALAKNNLSNYALGYVSVSRDSAKLVLALDASQTAIRLMQGVDPSSVINASSLCAFADANFRMRRLALAMSYASQCLTLASERNYVQVYAAARWLIGNIHFASGSFDKARESYLTGLDHLETLPQDYQTLIGLSIYLRLGQLYEETDNPALAEETYRQAIDLLEASFSSLSVSSWDPDPISDWQVPYRRLTRLLLAQQRVREAFLVFEQVRGQHFLNQRTSAYLLSDLSPQERAQLDSLSLMLEQTRDSLLTSNGLPSELVSLQAREAQLNNELQQFSRLSASPQAFSLPLLQRQLATRNQVVLSYFVDDTEAAKPQSHVFVVSKDTLFALRLETHDKQLSGLLAEVHPFMAEEVGAVGRNNHFNLEALHDLYTTLIEPVQPHIAAGLPLVILPDKDLYKLPFSALITKHWPRYLYDGAPFLIREHPLSVELSATSFVFGPPAYSPERTDIAAFGVSDFSDDAASPPSLTAPALRALPYVENELSMLENTFDDTQIFQNEDATRDAFFDQLTSSKVIHFASHALVHPSSSLYHALVFSPSSGDTSNEHLFLHQLTRRSIQADLVVLNGCNTAVGELSDSEGMLGFHHAFRALGIHSSLASLWYVDDFASSALVGAFYKSLAEGKPKDQALREATLTFLDSHAPTYQNPFYWAAPVLYGDVAPIDLSRRFNYPFVFLLIGLLILVAGSLAYFYSRKRPTFFHAV